MEACFLSSLNSSGYISQEALQQVGFCLGFLPQRLGRPLILKILYMVFLSIHCEPGIKMLCSSHLMEKSSFPRHHGPKCYPICMQMTYDAEGISVCANECWQHTPSLREMSLYLKFSEPIDYPSLCSPTDVNNWILPSGLHLGLRHFQIT